MGAVLWLSNVGIGLGTGMGTEAHLCATGSDLLPSPPRAWHHPGSQSLETSQDARKTRQLLSSKTGRYLLEMSALSRVTKLSSFNWDCPILKLQIPHAQHPDRGRWEDPGEAGGRMSPRRAEQGVSPVTDDGPLGSVWSQRPLLLVLW